MTLPGGRDATAKMRSLLTQPGFPETLECDLDLAASILQTESRRLRLSMESKEPVALSDRNKLKGTLVLRAMYNLEKKANDEK